MRQAVRSEMQVASITTRAPALLLARKYAMEIAANYSQAFVTFMACALGRLWNWLYDGVEFEHVENLSDDRRRRRDHLCPMPPQPHGLSAALVRDLSQGLRRAARGRRASNLNLPVVGRFLRKGGAFFLRRSFKGDALYAAVFTKYLGFMMARGHPLEYFIEGGRSRTGRLLSPRTGMLSMTVRSYLREPNRPVVFMPVYFGYERIVEGRTYIGELSGSRRKRKAFSACSSRLSRSCAASSARCT